MRRARPCHHNRIVHTRRGLRQVRVNEGIPRRMRTAGLTKKQKANILKRIQGYSQQRNYGAIPVSMLSESDKGLSQAAYNQEGISSLKDDSGVVQQRGKIASAAMAVVRAASLLKKDSQTYSQAAVAAPPREDYIPVNMSVQRLPRSIGQEGASQLRAQAVMQAQLKDADIIKDTNETVKETAQIIGNAQSIANKVQNARTVQEQQTAKMQLYHLQQDLALLERAEQERRKAINRARKVPKVIMQKTYFKPSKVSMLGRYDV